MFVNIYGVFISLLPCYKDVFRTPRNFFLLRRIARANIKNKF